MLEAGGRPSRDRSCSAAPTSMSSCCRAAPNSASHMKKAAVEPFVPILVGVNFINEIQICWCSLHATSTLLFLHLWNQVCSRVMRLVHITALVRTASDWRVWGCAHRSAARTAVMEHRQPSLPWCCGSQAVASSSRPPFLGHGDATAWAGVTATTLYFWNRQQSAAPGSLCFAHYAQEAKIANELCKHCSSFSVFLGTCHSCSIEVCGRKNSKQEMHGTQIRRSRGIFYIQMTFFKQQNFNSTLSTAEWLLLKHKHQKHHHKLSKLGSSFSTVETDGQWQSLGSRCVPRLHGMQNNYSECFQHQRQRKGVILHC